MSDPVPEEPLRRFRIIRPFLEEGVPLPGIARNHGVPIRTLRNWVRKYRERGMSGLSRKPRSDKGRFRAVAPELREIAEALALEKPKRTVAAIRRIAESAARREGIKPASYPSVRRIVRAMDPALMSLAHEGSKAYGNRFDLLYRREAAFPNEMWQADHTLLDIIVLNEKERPARPWLTAIMDDCSRAVAGYFLSFDAPSAMQTALALHQAIWRKTEPEWQICGIPDILYTDNGSDFVSRHIERVCADLKIRMVFSIPGKPRGRGRIERFFLTVNQRLLSALPGYRPAGSGEVKPVLKLSELDDAVKRFIVNEYNRKPHSATGVEPITRWNGNGFLPRLPDSREQLDLLLLTVVKPRRVHRDGIRFQGFRYIDPVLSAYVGESVSIRYDPRDLAEIRVYRNGIFLCRAVCQEIAGETVGLREIIRARNNRRRELRQVIRERQNLCRSLPDNQSFSDAHVQHQLSGELSPTVESEEKEPSLSSLKRYECD